MRRPTSTVLEQFSFAAEASSPIEPAPIEPARQEWVIEARGVYKKYCRDLRRSRWYGVRDVLDALTVRAAHSDSCREHEFWAVNDVSFQLRAGDALGVLGRNGSGKSTLLKLITGQRLLSAGTVRTRGRIVALNELGLGFNSVLTGRENAYVNAAVLGFSRRDLAARIEEIIDFAGIREFIDSAVQTYSSGMMARLGFAVAAHLDPDILIIDEVLAVGDLEFRRKCIQHILRYVRRGGSLLLVAHDPQLVQSICNRCLVLERGRVLFDGSGIEGVNFHFKLGHKVQHDLMAETAQRFLTGVEPPDSAVMQQSTVGETTETPRCPLPLTPEQPVIVDRFEMLAADGGPLFPGCRAKVVLSCRSSVAAEIGWGFTLCTADRHTIIASFANGMEARTSRVVPGANQFVCLLPELPLRPGVYAIQGGVGDIATQAAISMRGYRDAPDFFTVEESAVNRTNNHQSVVGALISIQSQWLS
jgi:ABC-type polysaccharide/polyol phosphate transport system ATPase subunit